MTSYALSPQGEYLCKLLEILLHGRFDASAPFISLYGLWIFVLHFELPSNMTLFVAAVLSVWAIRSSFSWLLHSSDIPFPSMCFSGFCFHFYFFELSPTRWHYRMLQDAHLVCFLPFLQGALTPL